MNRAVHSLVVPISRGILPSVGPKVSAIRRCTTCAVQFLPRKNSARGHRVTRGIVIIHKVWATQVDKKRSTRLPKRRNQQFCKTAPEQVRGRGTCAKFAAQTQHGLPDGLQRNLRAATALTQQSSQVARSVPLIRRAQQQAEQGILSRGQQDLWARAKGR